MKKKLKEATEEQEKEAEKGEGNAEETAKVKEKVTEWTEAEAKENRVTQLKARRRSQEEEDRNSKKKAKEIEEKERKNIEDAKQIQIAEEEEAKEDMKGEEKESSKEEANETAEEKCDVESAKQRVEEKEMRMGRNGSCVGKMGTGSRFGFGFLGCLILTNRDRLNGPLVGAQREHSWPQVSAQCNNMQCKGERQLLGTRVNPNQFIRGIADKSNSTQGSVMVASGDEELRRGTRCKWRRQEELDDR